MQDPTKGQFADEVSGFKMSSQILQYEWQTKNTALHAVCNGDSIDSVILPVAFPVMVQLCSEVSRLVVSLT